MIFAPIRAALAALPVLALAACGGGGMEPASGDMTIRDIDLNQCEDWDWRGQGEEDAKRGISADAALAKYEEDCEARAAGPDRGEYMAGYGSVK